MHLHSVSTFTNISPLIPFTDTFFSQRYYLEILQLNLIFLVVLPLLCISSVCQLACRLQLVSVLAQGQTPATDYFLVCLETLLGVVVMFTTLTPLRPWYNVRTASTNGSGAKHYNVCTTSNYAYLLYWAGILLSPMFSLRLHHFLTLSTLGENEDREGRRLAFFFFFFFQLLKFCLAHG